MSLSLNLSFAVLTLIIVCIHFIGIQAIIITGVEQFSKYEGYGYSLSFAGDHIDTTQKDSEGTVMCSLVAIDALAFHTKHDIEAAQYQESYILRELNKAYCGFYCKDSNVEWSATKYPSVATGNWGCGVFNGNIQLKFLIQWIAASLSSRSLIYFPFNSKSLADAQALISFVESNNINTTTLLKALLKVTNEGDNHGKDIIGAVLTTLTAGGGADPKRLSTIRISMGMDIDNDDEDKAMGGGGKSPL